MTREEFLDLYFDEAIDFINESDAGNELFSIDTAGELIKNWIDQGEWLLADHILHFIANESSGDYFIWDAGSGTFSEPIDVSEVDDLEDLADEYGLLESFRRKRTVKESRTKNPVRYLPVSVGKRLGIENYPNFSASGSVSGMRKQYYGDDALLVKCGSYIYNVTDNPDIYNRAK